MTQNTVLDPDTVAPKDAPCTHCLAKDGRRIYTTDCTDVVKSTTPNTHIECYDTVLCKKRRPTNATTPPSQNHGNMTNKFSSTAEPKVMYVEKCRHDESIAFEIEGIKFHGGSQIKVEDKFYDSSWLVVRLLGKPPQRKQLLFASKAWLDVLGNSVVQYEPQICIDWPDMQAPALASGFWMKLVAHAKTQGYTNVLFYCIGGHGRTGTALASVLVECTDCTPEQAVTIIREVYCKKTVETDLQVKYIERMYLAAHPTASVNKKATKVNKEKK